MVFETTEEPLSPSLSSQLQPLPSEALFSFRGIISGSVSLRDCIENIEDFVCVLRNLQDEGWSLQKIESDRIIIEKKP